MIKKRIVNIILAAFVIASFFLPFINTQPVYAVAWYNTNWQYRKSCTVTNGIASYTTKILVGETSGATGEDFDLGGFCQTDFDDIRFTGADGVTLLDYWIESITGTTPNQLATVWVENDTTPSVTVYIYYGNPSVTSQSSGFNTFPFFDDFNQKNWNKTLGDWGEHSVIVNNTLYQTASSDGIYMLNPDTGATIQHWLAGTNFWCSPVIIGDYIYAWNYISQPADSNLYKINQNTGAETHIIGTSIDFEMLTTANVGGIDLIFIPKGGYVTAIKASDLTTYWTSTVSLALTTYHWDAGMVVGNYLYTRQVGLTGNKLVKLNIATGAIVDEVALESECHYSVLVYDVDSDQIILTEKSTLKVKAFDAQTLDLNWSYKAEETVGTNIIVYGGTYYNNTYYFNVETSPSLTSYGYMLNTITGAKIWKTSAAYNEGVSQYNICRDNNYIYAPTHDWTDHNYYKLQVINVTNGVLYDTVDQGGDVSCATPMVWGGKIYLGLWDDKLTCRTLGSGQRVNVPYKFDAYHTGYIGTALTEYRPDKSPTNLSQWTVTGSSSVTQSSGTMVLDSVAACPNAIAYSTTAFDNTYATRSRMKTLHDASGTRSETHLFVVVADGKGYYMWLDFNGATYPGQAGNFDGAFSALVALTWTADTYGITEIIRNGATNVIYNINDANQGNIATNLTATNKVDYFNANSADFSALTTVDWTLVRKYSAAGSTFGSWTVASSPTVPSITTGIAVNITTTGATLQGTLNGLAGYTPVYCYFQYGISTAYGNSTVEQTETAIGGFSQAITGLSNGTTYHFRAVVRYDISNYIYGADSYFVAGSGGTGYPTISTGSATSITDHSATLQGILTSLGDSLTVYVSFDYGLTTAYGSSTVEESKTSTGAISAAINVGNTNTIYHFRAKVKYGVNSYAYGLDNTFTTTTVAVPSQWEYLNTGNDGDSDKIYGNNWAYQQFTVGATSHTVTSVRLYLRRVGTPGTVTLTIRNAASDLPTGSDLASATFDGSAISTSYAWYSFTVSEITITTTLQYAIVVRATAGDASNYIYWALDTGGGLANAVYGKSTDGGLTFATQAPKDALFEIWSSAQSQGIMIISAKVFTGYMTPNDWLIVADVNNQYTPYYPNDDPQVLFQLQLRNGTIIKGATSFKDWQRQPLAIYLSTATASALNWGGAYTLRIQCLPNTSVYSDYNLVSGDWRAGSLIYLDGYVKSLASTYQTYYTSPTTTVTLLTYTEDRGQVLNVTGGVMFDRGIPNLSAIRPMLFTSDYRSKTNITATTHTKAGETAVVWSDAVGSDIASTLTLLGNIFGGVNARDMGGFIMIGLFFIAAACAGAGSFGAGAVFGFAFIGIAITFRLIDWGFIFIFIILCAAFIFRGWYNANHP